MILWFPGTPCEVDPVDEFLLAVDETRGDWFPFEDCVQFKAADFMYRCAEMSASDIDTLLRIWDASLTVHGSGAPFHNHRSLYQWINVIVMNIEEGQWMLRGGELPS